MYDKIAEGRLLRVCIEVNLLKPLILGCLVGSSEGVVEFFQEFIYEGVGVYCYHCGIVSYRVDSTVSRDDSNHLRRVARLVDNEEESIGLKKGVVGINEDNGSLG